MTVPWLRDPSTPGLSMVDRWVVEGLWRLMSFMPDASAIA